jgi:two-component system, NtrC family, nitrogen regulation sensor histidine kinase NtrY
VPFYSTKDTGTGLGLTLCREIVEAHGGRLRIANREDGGAIVTIWLPDSG